MAARGKRRKRKDGTLADGRRPALPAPGFGIRAISADPVTPAMLAEAVDIAHRARPLGPQAFEEDDDEDAEDERDLAIEREIKALAPDDVLAGSLLSRWYQLDKLLRQPVMQHLYAVRSDSGVLVDTDLLRYAAQDAPVTDSPFGELSWPPPRA